MELKKRSLRLFALALLMTASPLIRVPQARAEGLFDWFDKAFGGGDFHKAPTIDPIENENGPKGQTEDQAALNSFLKQQRINLPFYITNTQWTDADEDAYSAFIHTLGAAVAAKKCGDINRCLRNPEANIYAADDPEGLIFYADCARLPYLLRAYFAYHNGLPFGYVTAVEINKKAYGSLQDLDKVLATARLDDSPYGNEITGRGGSDMSRSPNTQMDFQRYLFNLLADVSTRVLRVGPLTPGFDLSDVYPVKLSRDGIRPGTVVTATGHAMTVWNVNPDGSIEIIDGHPGAYVQAHSLNSSKLQRSRPDQGLGFYRFRPVSAVGAHFDANNSYYGGKIVTASDEQLYAAGKYSLEQWFGPGTDFKPGQKVDPNAWKSAFGNLDFFSYIASQLRDQNSKFPADQAVKREFTDICGVIQSRQQSVNSAVSSGLPQRPHPASLVADIFGSSDADWEEYSTPGSDARLKDEVRASVALAITQYQLAKQNDPHVYFDGSAQDYVKTLINDLHAAAKGCSVSYINSSGRKVTLTFNQVLSRLNRMSFDPYMCIEKMWGASGAELSTCVDMDRGNAWYNAERYMRNTFGKQDANGIEVVRSTQPITLMMLRDPSLLDQPDSSDTNLGTKTVPLMNIESYLNSSAFLAALTAAY